MSNDDFDKIPETVSISSDGATDDPDNSGFDQTNPDYFGNNTPDQLLIELEKALKLSDDVTELFINQLDKEREGIKKQLESQANSGRLISWLPIEACATASSWNNQKDLKPETLTKIEVEVEQASVGGDMEQKAYKFYPDGSDLPPGAF